MSLIRQPPGRETTVTELEKHDMSPDQSADLWPMGAVTRRTGISDHTLRAWERRFGFPKPVRLPSGHRRYTGEQVRHLLLINEALLCGYRAGDIVPLSKDQIEAMVREGSAQTSRSSGLQRSESWVDETLRYAMAFDESSIRAKMASDATILGVQAFLRERAIPLIEELGSSWVRGEIGIRHEHFVSGILEEQLNEIRTTFDAGATGRPIILACLPGESHGLGLQMVALEVSAAGRRNIVLGPDTPIDEIIDSAKTVAAPAVGLSVSAFASTESTEKNIVALRVDLPESTALWVGGSGNEGFGSLPAGVLRISTLDEVAEQVRLLLD